MWGLGFGLICRASGVTEAGVEVTVLDLAISMAMNGRISCFKMDGTSVLLGIHLFKAGHCTQIGTGNIPVVR